MNSQSSGQPFAQVIKIVVDPDHGVESITSLLDAALHEHRILHVIGGPEEACSALRFWEDVNRRLGRIDLRGEDPITLKRLPSIWNDIRYDPSLATVYRHSNTAQPLHTDGAYNADPPAIGFFFCEKQARHGGSTSFVDIDVLCGYLHHEQPQLYEALKTIPVCFSKGEAPGQIIPIITQHDLGPCINWNYYRVAVGQGDSVIRMCEAFFRWLDQFIVKSNRIARLHLEAGDCMIFHDLRCLHGREAFDASVAGDRCLWNLNLHWTSSQR